jgi:serine protease
MVRNRAMGWLQAAVLPLVLVGCASSSDDRTAENAENVGESQQQIVGALSKKFSISLPRGVALSDESVAAGRNLAILDRARVQEPTGVLAPVANAATTTGGVTQLGNDARSGTILSQPAVTLGDRSRVEGNVQSGGAITPGSQSVVTGTSTANTAIAFDPWSWTVNFPAASQNIIVPQAGSTTIAPGSFENVTINNLGTLRLSTGTYYLNSFDLEPQAKVVVDTVAGPVFIYVRTGFIWRGAINFTGPTDRLLVGYAGADSIALETPFTGTFVAPDATVRLAVGATSHTGAFFSKNLQLDPEVRVTRLPFAGWSGFQFDVVPRFECVQTAPNGTKVATFGYFNPNATRQVVPVGTTNTFSIAPNDRRQPTTFLPGAHGANFAVAYTGTAPSWQLLGSTASIDTTKVCNNTYQVPTLKDATLSSASPNANFGSATTIEVSAQKAGVFEFDRKAVLAARGAGRLIKSAKLEVNLSSGSSALDAYPMRQKWEELGATWTCGNDRDAASATALCYTNDRWTVPRRAHTYDNPYNPDVVVPGTAATGKVVFDVTEDVQTFLASGASLGWIVQARTASSTTLFSREGAKPAKLVIEAVPFTDTDFAGKAPFSFQVDTSLAISEGLPPFANGLTRPLAVLKTSEGASLKFAENELLVLSDDPTELSAFAARWGAVEVAAPTVKIPGVTNGHVFRIDTTKGDPTTLVPNLRQSVNRPDGLQSVSSSAALGLLAAVAEEQTRGTVVGINWLAPGADVDIDGINQEVFTDGLPAAGTTIETSSNTFNWDHFLLHDVNEAWRLMFFAKKLTPVIDVAMIDAGFDVSYLDVEGQLIGCAGGQCDNPFNCGGGNACPWHGIGTASSGFGRVNNMYGGAGPGAGVADVDLIWGFGDQATTLISVPPLVVAGEDIINFSNAIPVPDWASWTTLPSEHVMWAARHVGGVLIFASAGNEARNVDAKRCYDLWLTTVCPWEEVVWFPCEGSGVHCVGATNYSDKSRATSYSNYGGSVEYWATGTALVGADPSRASDGAAYHSVQGTSYASPFMAGTAALVWAANAYVNQAGDVEDCLEAAKIGGENGRWVHTYFAAACGMGSPSNLAPVVDIVQPPLEDNNYQSLGLVTMQAKAGDFEDGPITTFLWTSDKDGLLGTTSAGQPLLFAPTSPGLRTITVTVFDSGTLSGTDKVTLSFTPATPNLKILSPAADGDSVPMGLPVDLVGRMTNFTNLGQTPPYATSAWSGTGPGGTPLFSNVLGASVQATFTQAGTTTVTWTMTVDGQTGTASRTFNVFNDGKLHVKITNPRKENEPSGGKLFVLLDLNVPSTLSAVSTSDAAGGVVYTWNITRKDATGVQHTLATLSGASTTFTPTSGTGFLCGYTPITIAVSAINTVGELANDTVDGMVYRNCPPP